MKKLISADIAAAMNNASWIRKMFEAGNELRKTRGADNVFDFSLGNPDVPPPEKARDTLRALADDAIRPCGLGYMPNAGLPEFRAGLAAKLSREQGVPLQAKHVIATVGAAGALVALFRAILEPGDEILVPAPYFVEYGFYCGHFGGRLVPRRRHPPHPRHPPQLPQQPHRRHLPRGHPPPPRRRRRRPQRRPRPPPLPPLRRTLPRLRLRRRRRPPLPPPQPLGHRPRLLLQEPLPGRRAHRLRRRQPRPRRRRRPPRRRHPHQPHPRLRQRPHPRPTPRPRPPRRMRRPRPLRRPPPRDGRHAHRRRRPLRHAPRRLLLLPRGPRRRRPRLLRIIAVPGRGFGMPGHIRLCSAVPMDTILRAQPAFESACR